MFHTIEIQMEFAAYHWYIKMIFVAYQWNPNQMLLRSIELFLHVCFEISLSVLKICGVQMRSKRILLRTIELQLKFAAYHWNSVGISAYHCNSNEISSVPLKSKWDLLRTIDINWILLHATKIQMKFAAYHWNSNEISLRTIEIQVTVCCVPLKCT